MEQLIDLTYPLSADTPMYPGLPQPEISPHFFVETDGANVSRVSFVSHSGTHIDAPRHMFSESESVDEIPVDQLIGDAVVVDLSHRTEAGRISTADLMVHDASIGSGDILVLITGIYRQYGTPEYNERYPALDPSAARWLVRRRIAVYATDATSIEAPGTDGNPVHKILLGAGIPIIENLANVSELTSARLRLIALPLKVRGGDGAPCRVVAVQ